MLLEAADLETVCNAALDVGILEERDGRLELHPLARSFLVDRAGYVVDDSSVAAAAACYLYYTSKRDWDAAFEILSHLWAARGSQDTNRGRA